MDPEKIRQWTIIFEFTATEKKARATRDTIYATAANTRGFNARVFLKEEET